MDIDKDAGRVVIESTQLLGANVRITWRNGLGQLRASYGTVTEQIAPNLFKVVGFGFVGTASRESMEIIGPPNSGDTLGGVVGNV